MGVIKSALELALEKTEGLSVDKEELKRKDLFNKGRILAAKSIDEGIDHFDTSWKDFQTSLKKDELQVVNEGAMDNLLSRIVLSADQRDSATLQRVGEILDRLTKKRAMAALQQVAGLLQQYGTEVSQLKQMINQQLGPQLKQRATQQGANPATYQMERDPAYLKVLAENLEPMRVEYQANLDAMKSELRKLV